MMLLDIASLMRDDCIMTNRNDINARRIDALRTLADAMLESPDMLAAIESFRDLLTPIDFDALCFSIDICPMHLTDTDTCADDELTDCRDLR